MRIRAFHIDTFGTLRDLTVEGLPDAGAVFLGRNEAGKSTLLDFFRSTLTGYPRSRDVRERGYLSGHSGLLGGGLTLASGTAEGDIRLVRRPNVAKGEPSLTDAEGNPLDPALWERLLGGVTREVYASVYGFSLSELQSFSSLTTEGVRNALYGASFGMAGLRSPGAALKKLNANMEELFRARGSNPKLSAALRDWEEARREVRRAEEEAVRYDALAAERDALRGRLDALRDERGGLERERRLLERRLGVWERWEEWRLAGVRLERLEPVPATFPQDGPARLERALERRSDAERAVELVRRRLERTREALDACTVDERLWECGEALRALGGRTASCRNALAAIPGLRADLERVRPALVRELAALGPEWTAERVARLERPLSLREALERQAEERRKAASETAYAQAALDRAAEEAEALGAERRELAERLAELPGPALDLPEAERERLREAVARADEAQCRLPEAREALAEAERELGRGLERLGLGRGDCERVLPELAAGQDVVVALAAGTVRRETERKERERDAAQAEASLTAERETLERLRNSLTACPDRSAVDAKRSGIRRLRSVLSRLAAEEARLTEIEARRAENESLSGTESSPLMIGLGILLAVLGIAGGLLRWLGDIPALQLGRVLLPLENWLLGLFPIMGGAFVWAGFPRRRQSLAVSAERAERLQQRRDGCVRRLEAERRDAAALCRALGLADVEAATLDAFEAQTERELAGCAAGERLAEAVRRCERVCAEAERTAQAARNALAQAAEDGLAAGEQWLAWFRAHGVEAPEPEQAAAYCARVEGARMRLAAVRDRRRACEELEARYAALIGLAGTLPETFAPEAGDEARAAETVRRALECCREADSLREERRRLDEEVRALDVRIGRQEQARLAAVSALDAARSRQASAEAAWETELRGIGLSEGLSPATARDALDRMDRVQALDAERSRLERELARQERERDALCVPFRDLLERMGRTPDAPENGPERVEALLRELERVRNGVAEQGRLRARLGEQTVELREAEAVLRDAAREVERLLALAESPDPEAFYRRHAAGQEREALERRREDIEDALRLAARDMGAEDFEAFLASFGEADREALEARLAELGGRLAALAEEDERLADAARTLDVRLEQAAASDTLSRARQRASSLAGTIRELALEWSRCALARYLLLEARGRFEKERQPGVVRTASSLFAAITGGAWSGIAASLEDSSLRVLPPHGEPVSPEVLSRGTQEQLYLALRLAHIRNHAAQAAALPVIMDDVLVNFDPERAARTARAFGSLTAPQDGRAGHQLLYFTCHPHMADLIRESVPGSRLYVMDKGKVEARA